MFADKNRQTPGMSKKKKTVSIVGDIQSYLKVPYTILYIFFYNCNEVSLIKQLCKYSSCSDVEDSSESDKLVLKYIFHTSRVIYIS